MTASLPSRPWRQRRRAEVGGEASALLAAVPESGRRDREPAFAGRCHPDWPWRIVVRAPLHARPLRARIGVRNNGHFAAADTGEHEGRRPQVSIPLEGKIPARGIPLLRYKFLGGVLEPGESPRPSRICRWPKSRDRRQAAKWRQAKRAFPRNAGSEPRFPRIRAGTAGNVPALPCPVPQAQRSASTPHSLPTRPRQRTWFRTSDTPGLPFAPPCVTDCVNLFWHSRRACVWPQNAEAAPTFLRRLH